MLPHFGAIRNSKIITNDLGKFVEECWKNIPKHYPDVELDYYIIMPNHIHGIIILDPIMKNISTVGNENLRSLHWQ